MNPVRKIRFNAAYATMLLPFISKDPMRPYLNGIFVEPWDEGVILVATNGHILAAVHDLNGDASGPSICAIPPALAKALPKRISTAGELHFIGDAAYLLDCRQADIDSFDPTVPNHHHLSIAHAPAIDGTFPDWRRVIPTAERECSDVTINPTLVDSFRKSAAVVCRGTGITLRSGNASAPIIVEIDGVPEFVGCLMPMTDGPFVGWEKPKWVERVSIKDEAA